MKICNRSLRMAQTSKLFRQLSIWSSGYGLRIIIARHLIYMIHSCKLRLTLASRCHDIFTSLHWRCIAHTYDSDTALIVCVTFRIDSLNDALVIASITAIVLDLHESCCRTGTLHLAVLLCCWQAWTWIHSDQLWAHTRSRVRWYHDHDVALAIAELLNDIGSLWWPIVWVMFGTLVYWDWNR